MSDPTPAVSILMPVHNGLPFLTEAMDDLLAQTLADFELVVVEDASTDETWSVLRAYGARDKRIVLLRNETNLGLPRSLNRGLAACRAPLVARADADDRYEADRLERQVAFLAAHPEVGLLSCAVHKYNAQWVRFATVRFPTDDACIRVRELFVNCFAHPGVMFRTDLVRSVGGYDSAYWASQDVDLWSRLRPHTRVANLPEPLVHYRRHSGSITQQRGARGDALNLGVRRRLLAEYLQRPVSMAEAAAMVAVYRGQPLDSAEELHLGLRGLKAVHRQVCRQEQPATRRFFEREACAALLKQHERHPALLSAAGWALLWQALRWRPAVIASRAGAREVARPFLPSPLLHKARATRQWLRHGRLRAAEGPVAGS